MGKYGDYYAQQCNELKEPIEDESGSELCLGCPPADYPTDETRCLTCPRRAPTVGAPTE